MLKAEEIIAKEYGNSRNFITPTVIKYGMLSSNRAYELSRGTGFYQEPIFGVSLVQYYPETKKTERLQGKLFMSLNDAEKFIGEEK